MNFATLEFAIFLITVYGLYLSLSHRLQNYMLLAASYFFYAYWDWRFLSLLLIATVVNYWAGTRIYQTQNKTHKLWYLWTAIGICLGILGTFKYLGFFVDSTVDLLLLIGFEPHRPVLEIILPVGISFYTFQTLSYTIDIYREKLKPTTHFLDFSLFVAFFPQLVAGPIERATNLLPQIQAPRIITIDNFSRGCFLILLGLFKKIVIADGVAGSVNNIFSTTAPLTSLDILLAIYLFALQIYCDFSGYSDIARGTAKIMGFDLMTNFRNPLFVLNPRDFWNRWHISLSRWLHDYLYISLGGNRKGKLKTYRNFAITFFFSGLWHGAAWNFILWGMYQGILLSIYHFFKFGKKDKKQAKHDIVAVHQEGTVAKSFFQWFIGWLFFFQFIAYGWLLFRAESLQQIQTFSSILFFDMTWQSSINLNLPISFFMGLPLLLLLDGWQYASNNPRFYLVLPLPIRALLYTVLLYVTVAAAGVGSSEFIYFAF